MDIFTATTGEYGLAITEDTGDDGDQPARYLVGDTAGAHNFHDTLADAYADALECLENVIEWERDAIPGPSADFEEEVERRRLAAEAEQAAADLEGPMAFLRVALRGIESREAAEVVRVAAVEAVRAGALSEVKAAEAAGVARDTLRKWLGK